ncbi:hypothetical protein FJ366_03505 [Candidatus Dependentiae bacterium]|nr:hypothetical protein [Candidatus Dependentiae bacterium]
MTIRVVFLSVFIFVASCLHSVIIVVHGTFASNETWYRSNGDFVRAIRDSMAFLPDDDSCKNASIVSFRWSGNNSGAARLEAAKELLSLILSYPPFEPIVLILHSHAGNVGALVTNLLVNPLVAQDRSFGIDNVASLNKYIARCSIACADPLISIDEIVLTLNEARERVACHHMQASAACRSGDLLFEQRKIKRIYFLATPVDVSTYSCDMSVVENCYAFYSTEDMIQRVGGFYDRKFPQSDRLLNIHVKRYAQSGRIIGLGHSELRSPLIGFWLLLFPRQLEGAGGIKSEDYYCHEKINALLFEDCIPPFIPLESWDCVNKKLIDEHLKKNSSLKKKNVPDISIQYVNDSARMSL